MRRFSPGSRRWQVGHFDSCAGIRIPRRLFRLLLLLFIVAVRADVSLASWRVSFIASILTLVLVSFLFLVFVPSSLSLSQFWRHDSFLAGDMSRFCVGTRRCYWRFVSHQRVVTSFHWSLLRRLLTASSPPPPTPHPLTIAGGSLVNDPPAMPIKQWKVEGWRPQSRLSARSRVLASHHEAPFEFH